MDVVLAQPRGFCAGVYRAIEIVERALKIYGPPVYVLHEIVHNQRVVEDLKSRGAIFTEDLNDVPAGSNLIFSAHGVATEKSNQALERKLNIIDATCPLVTKVHRQVERHAKGAREVILIGHERHVEVNGTMGHYDKKWGGNIYLVESVDDVAKLQVKNPSDLAYETQTTLSIDDTKQIIDALRKRFPAIGGPRKDDICYATQNRQMAVKQMMDDIDLLIVVGARNSSNSNRLREVGEKKGLEAYLVQDAEDLNKSWFNKSPRVGLTAGASAPEVLVQEVLEKLKQFGVSNIIDMESDPEDVTFPLPMSLRKSNLVNSDN
jgi:4-hydroxy-3-methylbut-2-enyl diphosphate reductase